jgi:hypothetical protein
MTLPIPHEPQQARDGCGEAALCMVYRSLGLACTQQALRPAVSRRGRAWTRLLARDALGRGMRALIVEAGDPRAVIRAGLGDAVRMILNHRLDATSRAGHYSVVVASEEEGVVLHDPQLGPDRRLSWEELLGLWAAGGGSEISGFVLVAIACADGEAACERCGAAVPAEAACPWCGAQVRMQPQAVLGCVKAGCPGRLWRRCYCPWCDLPFNSTDGRLELRVGAG